MAVSAVTLEMLRMAPCPRATMPGNAACVSSMTALTMTARARRS